MANKADFIDIVGLARQYLQLTTAELDPYTSKNGEIQTEGLEVSLYTPSHIQYAKYGRDKGKSPPFDPIFEWVKAKNIQFPRLSKKGTAAAIMFGIGKKGTLNFKKDAPNAIEEALNKHFDRYFNALNSSIHAYLVKTTEEIYKNISIDNLKY